MSTPKSAGVTIPGVTTHEDAKQHAQNTGNYHATYRTDDGKKNVYFNAKKKPVVAKKADAAVEFGRLSAIQIKEAMRLQLGSPLGYGVGMAGGAGIGALIGAIRAGKGKRWQGAGRGAGIGAAAGAGTVLGGALTNGATYDHVLNHQPLVLGGNVLGGLAGAGLAGAFDNKPAPTPTKKKPAPKKEPTEEKQSAYNFGRLVKRSNETTAPPPRHTFTPEEVQNLGRTAGTVLGFGGGAGLGGLAGGAIGGLYGAIAPGEYVERDADGKPIAKQRGRIMGALRGMAAGAGIGGLGVGAAGGLLGRQAGGDILHNNTQEINMPGAGGKMVIPSPAQQMAEWMNSKQGSVSYNFGRLVKRAAINPEVMSGGLAGAGLGALGGGLAGLIAPGEEEDEDGNVKRRGRFSGALRGALGGAGLGGLAGAGMGYLRPTETGQGVDYLKNMIGMGGSPTPEPKRLNIDDPAVAAALVSQDKYGPLDPKHPLTPGGPRVERPGVGATTGAALPDTTQGGPSAKSLAKSPVTSGAEPGPSTYSPTPDHLNDRRGVDAQHHNTLTAPFGQRIDPRTGLPAIPFSQMR
jgi:hypothetical protein